MVKSLGIRCSCALWEMPLWFQFGAYLSSHYLAGTTFSSFSPNCGADFRGFLLYLKAENLEVNSRCYFYLTYKHVWYKHDDPPYCKISPSFSPPLTLVWVNICFLTAVAHHHHSLSLTISHKHILRQTHIHIITFSILYCCVISLSHTACPSHRVYPTESVCLHACVCACSHTSERGRIRGE